MFTQLTRIENCRDLLYAVGVIHRDLHGLNITDLPKLDFDAFLRNVITSIEWVSFFWPEAKSFLDGIHELLADQVPQVDPSEYTFCHGDFSCLQVIKDHDRFAVIDFDDCILGDPYMEIARLVAFLKYDVPLFRNCFVDPKPGTDELLENASRAYLKGYHEAQEGLNHKRLLWYRICFEIHYLARLFKRDLFHPLAFDRTVKIIHDLSERFQKEKG